MRSIPRLQRAWDCARVPGRTGCVHGDQAHEPGGHDEHEDQQGDCAPVVRLVDAQAVLPACAHAPGAAIVNSSCLPTTGFHGM